MQSWTLICGALLVLVGADECPDAGQCKEGQTCCSTPTDGYNCCPFEQAECCEDHVHCCPAGTLCDAAASSCVNATVSIPWEDRASADQPPVSKSFRMIKSYVGEDDDNVCPDQSRCPAEFSCLKVLTRFGCCPLAKGVSCSDGKHCCPEGHQCSIDSRSCIIKELVTTVLCNDGVSECPNGATCSETAEGGWGCCPIPKAVCCHDKIHCCSEGTTCDVQHMKCLSASGGEFPMWDKFPARLRADWENQKESENVISKEADDAQMKTSPEVTTVALLTASEEEVSPKADTDSASMTQNIPAYTSATAPTEETTTQIQVTVSMETAEEETSTQQEAEEDNVEDRLQCDDHTSCPQDTTCCFMASCNKWGCCPLPQAVCCAEESHCCPVGYRCDESRTSCVKEDVVIPWYTKIPAATSVPADPSSVQCDALNNCPEHTSCCKLFTGEWGCCPLPNAVCCADMEHCCPQGYTCDIVSRSCQKVIMLQLETIPLTPIYLPEYHLQLAPLKPSVIQCDGQYNCKDKETCCRTSATTWGCCPSPDAVCCSDMKHCCPSEHSCSDEGTCVQNTGPSWHNWSFFLNKKKKSALNL